MFPLSFDERRLKKTKPNNQEGLSCSYPFWASGDADRHSRILNNKTLHNNLKHVYSEIWALSDYCFLSEQLIKTEFHSFWGIEEEEHVGSATTKSRDNEEKKQKCFFKITNKIKV